MTGSESSNHAQEATALFEIATELARADQLAEAVELLEKVVALDGANGHREQAYHRGLLAGVFASLKGREAMAAGKSRRVFLTTFHQGFSERPWLLVDDVMSLLETVSRHLDNSRWGDRFPLVGRVVAALVGDGACGWTSEELENVICEVKTIEAECQSLPAAAAPRFVFDEEGRASSHPRETAGAVGSAREAFQHVFDTLLAVLSEAQLEGQAIVLERKGPRIQWPSPENGAVAPRSS